MTSQTEVNSHNAQNIEIAWHCMVLATITQFMLWTSGEGPQHKKPKKQTLKRKDSLLLFYDQIKIENNHSNSHSLSWPKPTEFLFPFESKKDELYLLLSTSLAGNLFAHTCFDFMVFCMPTSELPSSTARRRKS